MAKSFNLNSKTVLIFLLVLILFFAIWWLRFLLLGLVIAYSLASGLNHTTQKFNQLVNLGKNQSRYLVFFTILFFLGVGFIFLANPIGSETRAFLSKFPFYFDQFISLLQSWGLPIKQSLLHNYLTLAVNEALSQTGYWAANFLFLFAYVLIILTLSFYILLERERLIAFAAKLSPRMTHEARKIENRVYSRLGLWVSVQFVLALITGVLTYFVLLAFGVSYPMTLAFLTGILNLIPVIGPGLASIPALIIASLNGVWTGLLIFIYYNVFQTFKDNYISIKLVHFYGYNPMLILLAFIVAISLFDLSGALISIPILVSATVVIEEIKKTVSLENENANRKRLFIAFEIPEKIGEKLLRIKKEFPDNFQWQKLENLHLTIYFLGETEENNTGKITQKLKEIANKYSEFNFIFEKLIFAPENSETMLWAQFTENPIYNQLVGEIHNQINQFGNGKFKRTDRIPHVTLARIKEKGESVLPKIEVENLAATSFVLYESQPTNAGSVYSKVETFNLGGDK